MQIKQIQLIHLVADQGRVFANKETGDVLGSELWLGCNDSADNYVEVDAPPQEEETLGPAIDV